MRVVYGAGAVAVASVMAVGLVQPDFTATADQQATNDPNATDPNAADPTAADRNQGTGSSRADQQANTQVKHVIKYIHLKPGQTAPPGATVINPGQPTPRIVTANNPGPTAPPAPNHNPKPPANNPPPPPPQKPPPPPPPPTPRPTQKTHQSGHP